MLKTLFSCIVKQSHFSAPASWLKADYDNAEESKLEIKK